MKRFILPLLIVWMSLAFTQNNTDVTFYAKMKWVTSELDSSQFKNMVVEKLNPTVLSEVHAVSSNGQVSGLTIYCHPVIDTNIMDHTVHLVSGSNSVSLNDQNITDVVWEQIHGNASMTFADASEARFVGGDYYGAVTVTNNKGSTTKVFFGPDPDQCYIIKKVSPDKFQVIDRCRGYTVIATLSLKEIYDEMGTKLGDVPVVNDKLDVSQSGNSSDIRIIRVNINGENISKRFIKD